MEPPRAAWAPTPAALGALASGAALALGAAPTVTDRDAGELATAAFALDVAHPTGFPLDLALFRLAALAPVGDVAFRMNLAVAALGALACALAASLGARLAAGAAAPARYACALAPVAALVASASLLRAWTAVEVYAAAVALALGAVALLDATSLPEAARRRAVAALAGLSLFASHTSARPAVFLVLAVLLARDARSVGAAGLARRALPVAALALTTAALVLWLPVASRRDGPVDWNDPETPAAVASHLSAASIRAAYAGRMLVAWRLPEDAARAARVLVDDLGPLALALAALGALLAARRRGAGPTALVLAAVAAVDLAYAVAVNPMGIADRQTLFHAEAALALLAVVPVAWLGSKLSRPLAPALLALALIVAAVARRDPSWAGAADGWSAPELLGGAGALGAVPPRALVLCSSDDLCGGALYAQVVEGERPDVTVLPRQHLGYAWTWRRIAPSRLGESVAPPRPSRTTAADAVARTHLLLERLSDRVRWEGAGEGEDASVRARWRFGSGETPALAAVNAPVTDVDRGAARWVRERLPAGRGSGARWVGAVVLFAAGSRVAREDLAAGASLWRAALAVNPAHVSARTNLGVAAARSGDLGSAIALTRAALADDPERPVAWRNLRDFLRAAGDPEGAREAEREYLRRR